ncbi:MAG: M1 family metallopeptidase [Bacteroidetes bacterium]|nr:M1 family metallopeptidase [Bacteroidota bacterium]
MYKTFYHYLLSGFLLFSSLAFSQETPERAPGHEDINKFKQMYDLLATPNTFRTASGAPGPDYYQQQADYKMDIELDDANQKLYGEETITYTNKSPDVLEFLWVQLDQNVRSKDSKSLLIENSSAPFITTPGRFANQFLKDPFDGGFNIEYVKDINGKDLQVVINQTMMRVDLPTPLAPGQAYSFKIKWWYNINNHVTDRARSGYEHFEKDGNNAYVIAQFFPRMAVYNDVEGWQNHQFWGSGEFALPFGNYEVNITVPADHILDGTGVLQNRKEVFTKEMMKRYEQALNSYDEPVLIVTQAEAEAAEKSFSDKKKTWKLKAENVRDFAFATSRKFVYDMMAVDINGKRVMAVSMYPKEGNPLWEDWSTKAVASTLKSYSKYTFDYPYHKAISVHARNQGMEYPMICWNYGRPDENGKISDRVRFGMYGVIIHEVGHNFFPMIVNSDERQWAWMDEGINTFVQYLAEQEFGERYPEALVGEKTYDKYPSRRGPAANIVPYMSGDQSFITPIMANPEYVRQLGNNAYGKPATALNILRETVMGPDLFDKAFQTYSRRWMFKHPTPDDFFRTMEDASAVDLDWFWRGWFFTTDYVDIRLKEVKKLYITSEPTAKVKAFALENNIDLSKQGPLVYTTTEEEADFNPALKSGSLVASATSLKAYADENLSAAEKAKLPQAKFMYELTFDRPGGLVMPLIVAYTYADGTTEEVRYPAQIWAKSNDKVTKVLITDKEITKITVDPKLETADIDVSNNTWPREEKPTRFENFRNQN